MIEHLDGHTDIVHKLLNQDWLPWYVWSYFNSGKVCCSCARVITDIRLCRGMTRRDLLLQRYWRREDDGTYGTNSFEDWSIATS